MFFHNASEQNAVFNSLAQTDSRIPAFILAKGFQRLQNILFLGFIAERQITFVVHNDWIHGSRVFANGTFQPLNLSRQIAPAGRERDPGWKQYQPTLDLMQPLAQVRSQENEIDRMKLGVGKKQKA